MLIKIPVTKQFQYPEFLLFVVVSQYLRNCQTFIQSDCTSLLSHQQYTRTAVLFFIYLFLKDFYLLIHERHRKREAETQAEGEAGSMHREPDVGFDQGSPGSRPGPKAGAKPLRHPGIPKMKFF